MNKCIKKQGQCSICGMVKEHDGETNCHLEVYDESQQWKCPA